MTFDPVARKLRGTPTAAGTYPMTYRVRDSSGSTDTPRPSPSPSRRSPSSRSVVAAIRIRRHRRRAEVRGRAGARRRTRRRGDRQPRLRRRADRSSWTWSPIAGTAVDKLLLSIARREPFGYYEVDLPDARLLPAAGRRGCVFDLRRRSRRVCLDVSAVDAGGTVGPPTCHVGHQRAHVGFGDVQVTVSWDSDADLDLHVADPNGDEVYFRRVRHTVDSGGVLVPQVAGEVLFRRPHPQRAASHGRVELAAARPLRGARHPRRQLRRRRRPTTSSASTTTGTVTTYTGTFTGPGDEYSNARHRHR